MLSIAQDYEKLVVRAEHTLSDRVQTARWNNGTKIVGTYSKEGTH